MRIVLSQRRFNVETYHEILFVPCSWPRSGVFRAASAKAQTKSASEPAKQTGTERPDGPVFTSKEVDKKAVVKSKPEPDSGLSDFVGEITLAIVLRADGKIGVIRVLKAGPDDLNNAAIAAARRIKFTPAMKDGHAVSQYVAVVYHFDHF